MEAKRDMLAEQLNAIERLQRRYEEKIANLEGPLIEAKRLWVKFLVEGVASIDLIELQGEITTLRTRFSKFDEICGDKVNPQNRLNDFSYLV